VIACDAAMRIARRAAGIVVLALTTFGIAVGAAATLPIDDTGVGAGTTTIASCDPDGIATSYGVVYDTVDERYEVATVTVQDLAPSCAGESVSVVLLTSGGTVLATAGPVTVSTTSAVLGVPGSPLATLVARRHVLVAGA
jgi:3-dehydroquinate synthase class II